ncbi:HemK2/MTQ2 family protein methyltransferase [Kitasatospora sp. NPDC059673]|uniref:HemK2/MTQ2 family protein methyltransferase n=1 Tax=Kitasatospora sp. NPDC059673 TaxID=3346901 RepID=UPI0036AC3D94
MGCVATHSLGIRMAMVLLRPPGVYPVQGDTALLLETFGCEPVRPGARCLDLGTGCGVLALAAARRGCRVTAVDLSRRALATAWLNAHLHRLPVRLRRGDLTGPVLDEQFDLVLSNPPYVPARDSQPPGRGPAVAWDAGPDGRQLLDRLCRQVPLLLAPGGVLLLVQSSLAQPDATVRQLRAAGLQVGVIARKSQRFGPVMTARAQWFEDIGLIEPGVRTEELAVVRGVRH